MAFSSEIGRICLQVFPSGSFLPLVLLFGEKFFGYSVTIFVLLSVLIKALPKKYSYKETRLVEVISSAVLYLQLYFFFGADIFGSCVFSLSIQFFQYIISTFSISLITSVLKTIQLWIKLRNDILESHSAWKKYLYYGIWTIDKLCKVSVVISLLYEISHTVDYFYKDHGLTEIEAADIETNDCIPYTSFPSDLEESVSVYYVNESLSYLGDHLIISDNLTMSIKENSKLCKTFRGEDFLVTFNITQDENFANHNVEYYWSFNGTRIRESSPKKYEFWERRSGNSFTFNFLVIFTDYRDAGSYVLHRKTKENYSLENRKIKYQMLQKDLKQFSYDERNEIIVDRKILKFYLIHYMRDIHSYREMGTLIEINNFFKISTFQFRDSELKLIHLINRNNVMDVCPFNSSCNPTVSIYHNKKQFHKQTSELNYPVSVFRVNISFCVCPQAYGIHEFYFRFDDYHNIRFPLRLTLSPPKDVFNSSVYLAIFEGCKSKNNYFDPFDIILNSYRKRFFFYSNMEERFIKQKSEENFFILTVIVIWCIVEFLIDKIQRVLIYYFFIHKNYQYVEQNINQPKRDIFISYCSEDRFLAEELLLPFIKNELKYTVRTQNDILGNMNTRQALKEYIQSSKVLVLLISKDYLNDDLCYKLEYEMTILMSVAESRIKHGNLLVIKSDDCQTDVDPLKRFESIDWTNTLLSMRPEEEKKEELKIWLRTKLKPNIVRHIFNWISKPFLRAIKWLYYAGQ